jgi:hypothetical protein
MESPPKNMRSIVKADSPKSARRPFTPSGLDADDMRLYFAVYNPAAKSSGDRFSSKAGCFTKP